jgi:hypothetical protein
MKYETSLNEDGSVHLKLGTVHSVTFAPESTMDDVVGGLESLVEAVLGVSVFEMGMAVVKEFQGTLETNDNEAE